MSRFLRPLLFLIALILLIAASRAAESDPVIFSDPALQTTAPTGRVVLQYAPEITFADEARIAALAGARPQARLLPDVLAALAASKRVRPERLDALARYAHFDASHLEREALLRLVRRLAADPAVVTAFLEPRAVPAALGFDAFAKTPATGPTPPVERSAVTSDTPDFSSMQGYLTDAPLGIGATSMASQPGARGGTVRIVDVEGAWLWSHEDLPTPFLDLGQHIDNLSWRNHGTAVVGVMRGSDNGYGVIGIVPDCQVGSSSIGDQSVAGALLNAGLHLDPGDLILIELHGAGPNSYEGGGQYGYMPMEFWPDNFDAIRALTDQGLIIVEAAGNGQQDLDDPLYQGLFDRQQRDSGAIMSGATNGGALDPAWFTNHGARVDLCGWGYQVTTTGYGDLQNGPETEWYTQQFSGTSSASPIVTGSVASLQGMVEAAHGLRLDAALARLILAQTGTPTNGPQLIGPRPDLVAAWDLAALGVGQLTGTVTDQGSGLPLADVSVRLLPDGPDAITGSDGTYRLCLLPGAHDLQFSSYYHQMRVDAVVISSGLNTHDTALALLPVATVSGTVFGSAQEPLAGVGLVLAGEPLPAVQSQANGTFTLPPLPVGRSYLLLAGGAVQHGGRALEFTATEIQQNLTVVLPPVTDDFESGPAGYTTVGDLWQRGDPSLYGIGPGAAFDGQYCWGIGLDGAGYPDDAQAELWSPLFASSQFSGDRLYLSFHYWRGTEAGYDGVNVVLDPEGQATIIYPLAGYTDLFLSGIGHRPGWSGVGAGWQTAIFDVTDQLAEPSWRFALRFGSDVYVTDVGFMIDGVTLHDVDSFAAAPGAESMPEILPQLAAWPNPFNPRVTLAWSLAAPGRIDLAVYDLRGRLVRRLLQDATVAASDDLIWDGTDQTGRALASGVYLVRLQGAGHQSLQRITLTR